MPAVALLRGPAIVNGKDLVLAGTLTQPEIDAAHAAFDEHRIGSIETDKLADFIVIDRDYMTCPTREIADIRVVATYVEGFPVYMNPELAK